ncbi:MAG: lyase family protein, partial [Opitutales bacterium]
TGNSMDAVADRDCYLDFAHACAMCGVHMSRVAEDMILWNSAEFGFADLPDAYTTGSSMMPQKKNPDCMELIRGKSARLQGNLHTLYAMVKGLPMTYNRDLQEDKPPVFDSLRQTRACLQVMAAALAGTCLDGVRCEAAVADPALLATDLADYLVLRGVPFRKAHHLVGALVALAEEKATPLDKLPDADAFALDPAFGPDWREVFNLSRAMAGREKPGMPGPGQVAARIRQWREAIAV